jgi:Replication-relaxation
MAGNGLALTERDKAIVREVGRFGVMTRQQLTALRFFHSGSRAKERLKRLVEAGYLVSRAQPLAVGGPQFVYATGPLVDASLVGRKRFRDLSDPFLTHELGLVDIHIAFERVVTVTRWISAKELAGLSLGVIPDAYLEFAHDGLTFSAFVEYDRGTETLGRFERKIRAYVELARSGRFERFFQRQFFRVLALTDTSGRLTTLSTSAARITDKVLRFTTLGTLTREGPLQSIWRRPGATTLESITT